MRSDRTRELKKLFLTLTVVEVARLRALVVRLSGDGAGLRVLVVGLPGVVGFLAKSTTKSLEDSSSNRAE